MNAIPVKTVLLHLLACITTFYTVYYVVSSITFGALRLTDFDGKMPFDFENFIDFTECCTSYSDQEIANFISLELCYFLCTWLFLGFLTTRLWDYAVTTTLIHVAMSSLVMLAFPLNWSWWICLGVGLVLMVAIGEMFNYWRHRIQAEKIEFENTESGSSAESVVSVEQYLSFGNQPVRPDAGYEYESVSETSERAPVSLTAMLE